MTNANEFETADNNIDTNEDFEEMETNDQLGMEIFVPQVLTSEGQYEGTEVSRKTVTPGDFTPAKARSEFNLDNWVADGFTHSDQVSFFPVTREIQCSHMVAISHVLRMNTEYNDFIPGVRDIYNAQNPSAKSKWEKEFPFGKPGSRPYITGRGLVTTHDFSDVILTKHFSYEEQKASLVEAFNDVQAGVRNDMPHKYTDAQKLLAAAAHKCGFDHAALGKDNVKELLAATDRKEKAINSIFSFDYADYGINDESEDDVATNIHNRNRAELACRIGALAMQAGVQPKQYFELVVIGYTYKAIYHPASEDYPDGCVDVRYHHTPNVEGGVPAGIVLLCRPIAEMTHAGSRKVGNANSKNRLLKALSNKPVSTQPATPVTVPTPKAFVMPTKAVIVQPEKIEAPTRRGATKTNLAAYINKAANYEE